MDIKNVNRCAAKMACNNALPARCMTMYVKYAKKL